MLKPSTSSVIHFMSFVIFLLSFFIMLFSCTDPTTPSDLQPDTTSHNFSWTIDTIGTRNSYLKDVAIIDANNIWAIGEIHTEETDRYYSLGVWQPPFNAVHWNGNEWEYKRTLPTGIGFSPNRAVFAFNADDIWVGTSAPYHWDGQRWTVYNVTGIHNGYINKIWGTSSNDLYLVGTNGSISHYNGQSWQRLESGTTTDINDIWGVINPETGEKTILCPVSSRSHTGEYRLLSISENIVNDTLNWTLERRILSVWFDYDSPVYECGSGLRTYQDNIWKEIESPSYITLRVRGSSWNNVFVVGVFGLVMHYNGSTWRDYPELAFENGELKGLAVTDNLVVATGQIGKKGIIIIGKNK